MTKPYPTLPLSVLDDLNNLNSALVAYDLLITAFLEAGDPGPSGFAHGVSHLLRPVIEGYQDIHSQVEQFRQLGTVSVLTIPDQE